jgi:hypothetical protein
MKTKERAKRRVGCTITDPPLTRWVCARSDAHPKLRASTLKFSLFAKGQIAIHNEAPIRTISLLRAGT